MRRQFESGVYRGRHTLEYTASLISLFVCIHNEHAHTFIASDPLPWGEISWVAYIGICLQKRGATFRGRQDFEMWRDFKEMQYIKSTLDDSIDDESGYLNSKTQQTWQLYESLH